MGLSPRQVDDLTVWEFVAIKEGWRIANGGKPKADGEGWTAEEMAAFGIDDPWGADGDDE